MRATTLPAFVLPYFLRSRERYLLVELARQTLSLVSESSPVSRYPVSTALAGPGERAGSEATPRGWHIIRAKIGAQQPPGTVFRGRRPTGEIYTAELGRRFPERDWILTRILWLSGLEVGRNRLGSVDTMRRYIYIHGCPDEAPVGIPRSHGCIRMRNRDVVELFDQVEAYTPVLVLE
ncbi:MAG: L,D-transpeptidase [Gammaproteobacteria bacterium]